MSTPVTFHLQLFKKNVNNVIHQSKDIRKGKNVVGLGLGLRFYVRVRFLIVHLKVVHQVVHGGQCFVYKPVVCLICSTMTITLQKRMYDDKFTFLLLFVRQV